MENKALKITSHILIFLFVLIFFPGCASYRIASYDTESLSDPGVELLERAQQHTWQREYTAALNVLDEAEKMEKISTEVSLMRGHIFYTLERWDDARQAFNAVLAQAPGRPEAVVHLWFIDAMSEGFGEETRGELTRKALAYLEENPNEPEAVYATVLGLEGAKSVPEKTRVIEGHAHRVENPHWREELAEIYFYDTLRAGKVDWLMRAEFFRREFPKHRLRYNIAHQEFSILTEGGPEAVQSKAEEILKMEPENRVLNYLSAKAILEAGGDLDTAAVYIQRAIRAARNPDSADRYKYVDDATWQKFMDQSRADYAAVNGRITFLQGNTQQALEHFKDGLGYDTQRSRLNLWYAEALEAAGKPGEAMHYFRASAALEETEDSINGMRRLLTLQGIDTAPAVHLARLEGYPRFTEVTVDANMDGITGRRVAWSDLDQDGFPDVVVGGNTILKNKGDGTFEDVTEISGIDHGDGTGSILADFDKDGFPDMMVFCGRKGPRLYGNRTGQARSIKMVDVTETALPAWPYPDIPTEAAAAADVDGDGYVDIYLANFEKDAPTRCMGTHDVFYVNQGDGTFKDATSKIFYTSEEGMCGRGASFADINGDRKPDLFVSNYRLDPDFLLLNNSGGKGQDSMLVDRARELHVRGHNFQGAYGHSIGGTWGYLEIDRPTLFVASLAHPRLLGLSDTSTLYMPSSETEGFHGHFEDLGFTYHETHSDPSFIDVDQDGDLDLFLTSVYGGSTSFMYLNDSGRFDDKAWLFGLQVYNGWGSAWADYDRDGDPDLLVCVDRKPRLLRNESQSLQRTWLAVRAIGNQSPVTGIGTKVVVQTKDKALSWVREIRAGRGTGNQDEAIAHFGLGENKGPFRVIAQFPSGADVILDAVQCCQRIEVTEPSP